MFRFSGSPIMGFAANFRTDTPTFAGMSQKSQNERILFGLKVKQLRQARGLNFADFARHTGMSVSYLNEIEKGKKFPKEDKVGMLAVALGVEAAELLSADPG
jgi:hypothetical protein